MARVVTLAALLSPALRGLAGYVNEHTLGTPAFNRAMASGLHSIPHHIHAMLHHHGRTVATGSLIVDIDPSLKGQPVRGQPGITWDQAAACYDPQTMRVILAEFRQDTQGQVVPMRQVEALCREEIGHALDAVLGDVSHHDQGFVSAYHADAAAIADPGEQARLAYLLQPGEAGREETFAFLFAQVHGGCAGTPADLLLISQRFRRTIQAVRVLMPAHWP